MLNASIDDPFMKEVQDKVKEWRRHLHRNPELSFKEEKTSQFVFDELMSFGGLKVTRPTRTSVMARLIGEKPGKVLGLRADMDALPIQEETNLEFASDTAGVMHACGHDGHTAMLLGAAKILSQRKDEIRGEIRFIFQHAEELPPGGAQELVRRGVVDDVDYIVGLHLMSTLSKGKIGIVYGPITSNSDTFDLKIKGKGGHSSQPENSIDPIAMSAQIISNLQQIVSRNLDPSEKLVVSTTTLQAGTAKNVIPETVQIGGSVRSFSPNVRKQAVSLIERIVKGVTEAHGGSYEFHYQYGYDSVINDLELTKAVEELIVEEFGSEYVEHGEGMMGGEDFSAYLAKAPGCFVAVGARNEEKGIMYPHHHPRFDIDEEALKDGVRILVNLPKKILCNQKDSISRTNSRKELI
ncbi:amidohydrolase [Bacillus pakistanensis]|uniref:Amidohydrolase n=1 Tax=Rossellomorea pakistanensis TaxID=992288 RepID=A0ABS2N6X1_9BACI|nr:amidohydrolase [Bacillus pakistanensis]MBM7583606.1 amidohydrolase [Bacillus pakistanensis]